MREIDFVNEIRKSDEALFEENYFLYHKPLYYLALKFLKEKSLAEDVVQEAFIRLWNYRTKLDESRSVKGFLFTTTKNLVLNKIRDNRTQILKQIEIARNAQVSGDDSESNYILAEMRQFIEIAIGHLSARKREIFMLKVYDGLSNEEVATRLGISINTVKFQFSQALRTVRELARGQALLCFPFIIFMARALVD